MASDLFLGEDVDPAAHERTGTSLTHPSDALTTHGVIVGMTGSGKTGLGVVLLEEAMRAGIPTLVLDPKGDMTNLALRFPGLSADEFAPWVPAGVDAAATARTWTDGLAGWGLGGADVGALAEVPVTVYTPGSTAGVPVNLIGSMAAPTGADAEAMAEEVEGLVSGLLALVGIDADPLASREHILLSNLVTAAWARGAGLDLGTLVAQVQDPPMRKLGVLEVDTFFPPADRAKLALTLNGLLASPTFAAWSEGEPLDIGAMVGGGGGARCSVLYLAHLSEPERQFVVTLVLSKLVTWMRAQSGAPDLRALVYMDEVYGYVPPTSAPPAKKPILTLLKQARAFGVGVVLSTQNPVDLDYKAISNAGTWMIGRLQTERDIDRLRDGLSSASGGTDVAALAATIAGLAKREFVLHTTASSTPRVFTTRWALDYLAGPLTKDRLAELPGGAGRSGPAPSAASTPDPAAAAPATPDPTTAAAPAATPPVPATPSDPASPSVPAAAPATSGATIPVEPADDEVATVPAAADGALVRFVDPAAPWLGEVGGDPGSTTYAAGLAVRVSLLFDDAKADLRHTEEFECVVAPLGESFDAEAMVTVDYDDRDLREAAPTGVVYRIPEAAIDSSRYLSGAEKAIRDALYRNRSLELPVNEALRTYGRPGEDAEAFAARCAAAADEALDAAAAKLRARIESKVDTVRRAIEREQIRIDELEDKAGDAKQHELVSAAGDVLGSLLGGRRSARSILSKVKGASSRRKQSSAAAGRVDAALAKLEAKTGELRDLEDELAAELADLAAEWDDKAAEISTIEVGLEKTDISIVQAAVIWLPV